MSSSSSVDFVIAATFAAKGLAGCRFSDGLPSGAVNALLSGWLTLLVDLVSPLPSIILCIPFANSSRDMVLSLPAISSNAVRTCCSAFDSCVTASPFLRLASRHIGVVLFGALDKLYQ